jgi:hypothetical protein
MTMPCCGKVSQRRVPALKAGARGYLSKADVNEELLEARQIPHRPLDHLVDFPHSASTTRTPQNPVPALAANPQSYMLSWLVDLVFIDPIAGEPQYLRPVVVHAQPSSTNRNGISSAADTSHP